MIPKSGYPFSDKIALNKSYLPTLRTLDGRLQPHHENDTALRSGSAIGIFRSGGVTQPCSEPSTSRQETGGQSSHSGMREGPLSSRPPTRRGSRFATVSDGWDLTGKSRP